MASFGKKFSIVFLIGLVAALAVVVSARCGLALKPSLFIFLVPAVILANVYIDREERARAGAKRVLMEQEVCTHSSWVRLPITNWAMPPAAITAAVVAIGAGIPPVHARVESESARIAGTVMLGRRSSQIRVHAATLR